MLAAPVAASAQQPARAVAITFDDLPVVSRRLPSVAGQRAVTERLVAALRAHAVPAIGFVNEGKFEQADGTVDTARVGLLRLWTAAGLELGNHTRSHADLHRVPLDQFLEDIDRGDAETRRVLAEVGRTPAWFRHPYLHTGRSLAVRDSVTRHLARRGYRVAPVTADNHDFAFAAAYDVALMAGDSATAARIVDAYLDYMTQMVEYWERQSLAIVGREIPQVLLLHASRLNADCFGGLAERLAARGYAFAPIEHAVQDPAYALADEYVGPTGVSWLQRWGIAMGLPGQTFGGAPEVPEWIRAVAQVEY